jgi:amidase
VELAGLRVGYSPDYPSFVAGEIRAGTDALAAELQELGVIVEDRLPDPALAEYGQVVEELWPMLVSASEAPAAGADEPGSGRLWNYLAALNRRDRFMASWERFFATCDAFIAPAMPMSAWRVDDGEWRVDAGRPADDSPQAQPSP